VNLLSNKIRKQEMKGTNVSQDLKYFEIMKRKYKGIKYLSQLKDRAHRLYDRKVAAKTEMPVNGLLK